MIIIFYLFLFGVAVKQSQIKDEKNPHNLKSNPKNCLYCHNKVKIPEDNLKEKRVTYTHKFDLSEENCSECHIYESSQVIQRFKASITELCIASCHEQRALSLNHPVDISPSYIVSNLLPLENGQITCGTCHDPHNNGTKKVKELLREKDVKTYYLRIENSDGELCRTCHVDYPIF